MKEQSWQWAFDLFGKETQEFLSYQIGRNALWDWFQSLALLLLGIVLARLLYRMFGGFLRRLTGRTKTRLDDILVDKLEEPLTLAVVIIFSWWAIDRLEFAEGFQTFLNHVFHILIAIDVTWLLVRIVDAAITEYIVPVVEKSESVLDDQMLPILRKGLRGILWIIGITVGLNNAGYDVGALLAGVGIGGIAMAMAAKDFVANIFGGITVFLDKPFTLGDRIKINGYDGFVQEIGIRSTRIKTLAGRIITIPNYKFTDSEIENVTSEPTRRVIAMLGLTYDTTPAQMQQAIDILAAIVSTTQEIEDKHFATFESFGDFSLNIQFIYYISREDDIMTAPTVVNLQILERFNAAGLDFAFPTQTIYASTES